MPDHSAQNKRKSGKFTTGARSVSDLMGKVLEPLLARRTGMTLDLIKAWPEIAGEEFSDTTKPEKINWPRRIHEDDPFKPATLIVACEPSVALFFQHQLAALVERVNLFFGFEAIKRISIIQKPVSVAPEQNRAESKQLNSERELALQIMLEEIEDPELRKTLARLGRGIFGSDQDR